MGKERERGRKTGDTYVDSSRDDDKVNAARQVDEHRHNGDRPPKDIHRKPSQEKKKKV
jgi:hypothetical protein